MVVFLVSESPVGEVLKSRRQGERLSFLASAIRGDTPTTVLRQAALPAKRVSQGPPPTTEDVRAAIAKLFKDGEDSGLPKLHIRSGDLHRHVGGYPGTNGRMPSCCNAMREVMTVGDLIVAQPPKKNGASLEIRYTLPR